MTGTDSVRWKHIGKHFEATLTGTEPAAVREVDNLGERALNPHCAEPIYNSKDLLCWKMRGSKLCLLTRAAIYTQVVADPSDEGVRTMLREYERKIKAKVEVDSVLENWTSVYRLQDKGSDLKQFGKIADSRLVNQHILLIG